MNDLLSREFLSPLRLLEGERVIRRGCTAPPEWTDLLLGRRNLVRVPSPHAAMPAGSDDCAPRLLFPGSFNPLHQGHVRMAQIASARLGQPVWFELSITNVDKPPLDFLTIRERLDQLTSYNACLTRAPTFVEKADLFPGATFIVGADTLARIAEAKYYHGDQQARDDAIARLARAGARFLVFGRTLEGSFATLSELPLPPRLAALCEGIPDTEFREDVSSTELRGRTTGL